MVKPLVTPHSLPVQVPQAVAAPAPVAADAAEEAPAAEPAANGVSEEAAGDSGEAGFEAAEAPVPASS